MLIRKTTEGIKGSPYKTLLFVWAIVTIINVTKAFHIDDVFHLEAAKWIQHNPLKPMSGSINWENISEPIYNFNQPPGYFYFVALVGCIFGFSEIPLHLAQSLFSLLGIIFFYKLLYLFRKDFALVGALLLALGPAFLVNQNLMIDIPILSLSIIFVYLLVQENAVYATRNIYLASGLLTVGLLFKYSLLPLYLVLVYAVWEKKSLPHVKALLIPIVALLAWTALNYIEFGGSHMLGRQRNELSLSLVIDNFTAFLLTIGGVTPYSLLFLDAFIKQERQQVKVAVSFVTLVFVVTAYLLVYGPMISSVPYSLLWVTFACNGFLIIVLFLLAARRAVPERETAIIFLWGLSMGTFIVIYAPFMATRHVLLLLPPFIVLCNCVYRSASSKAITVSIVLTCFLGIALGVSDWLYADFYRRAALTAIKHIPENSKVWTAGHWGWQWYSKQAGMVFYEYDKSTPVEGDYFVSPEVVSKQKISTDLRFEKEVSIPYRANLLNMFSTAHFARFYNSYSYQLPWYLSTSPVDSVVIYRVSAVE